MIHLAMILAAGRGERLRPLTDAIPKALCEVNRKSLIAHHLNRLKEAGFSRVIINHAHLGGQIRRHVGNGAAFGLDVCYSPEPPGGLETGGGIFNALPLLGTCPFLTVNADIYIDCNFQEIKLPEESSAHLLMINNPKHNPKGDFSLNSQKKLCSDFAEESPTYTFSGVAVYDPLVFHSLKAGRFPLKPLFQKLIKEQRLSGELFRGLWIDIGTQARLDEAREYLKLC